MTYPDKISTQTVATTPTAKTDNSLQDWFSDEMASDAIARDVALVNFSLIDGYEALTEFIEACERFDSHDPKWINHELGILDDQHQEETTRCYYGSPKAKVFNLENAIRLPYSVVTAAIEITEGQKEFKGKRKRKRKLKTLETTESLTSEMVREVALW